MSKVHECPCFCPDDRYVLLHVSAEHLGGGVWCGQTRHPYRQWQPSGLDSSWGALWAIPDHIWGFSHKYWLWVTECGCITARPCLKDCSLVQKQGQTCFMALPDAVFDIKACSINGTDHLKPKCPVLNEYQMPAFPEWLTIIMLCIYLLFANILLLNLLIAIFK